MWSGSSTASSASISRAAETWGEAGSASRSRACWPRPKRRARAAAPRGRPVAQWAHGPRSSGRGATPPRRLHPRTQRPPLCSASRVRGRLARSPCSGDLRPAARPGRKSPCGNLTCNISFSWLQSRQLLSTGALSPMATFTQYTIATAPDASRPLLEQVDKALGFIPNLYATFAESPALLQGALGLDAGLDKGALSGVERQLVKIAVSTENGCTYCVAAHSTIAGMLKARPEIVNAVRTGVPVSDAKIDALVRFTRAVVRNKGFVQDGETAAFLAAGYTKAQVLEVVGHVAAKTLANYIHAITNAPLDAAFQPQRWDAKQLKVA